MKKYYIAPQLIEELFVEGEVILAESGKITSTDERATVTPGQGEYSGNDWASRHHDVWADDEDYEEF